MGVGWVIRVMFKDASRSELRNVYVKQKAAVDQVHNAQDVGSSSLNLVVFAPVSVGQTAYPSEVHDAAWGISFEVTVLKLGGCLSRQFGLVERHMMKKVLGMKTNLITSSRCSSLAREVATVFPDSCNNCLTCKAIQPLPM